MEQRPVTENNSPSTNSPLWFLAGLWLGSTGAAQGFLVFIGIVAFIGIFIIGTIFSALVTLFITHWPMLVILGVAALFISWMVVLYIREEQRKVV